MVQIERERAAKWGSMLTNWKKYWGTEKLHRRVTKGIPDSVRGAVWKHVLGIDNIRQDGIYEVIVLYLRLYMYMFLHVIIEWDIV